MIQLEGLNPVKEGLRQGTITFVRVERGKEADLRIKPLLDIANRKNIPVEIIPRVKLDKLSVTGHHQGIIAIAQPNKKWGLNKILAETGREICILLLDQVQDPHNLGAIIRTCDGAGVDGVIIPKKGSAGVNTTVHRISMGGSLHIPVWQQSLYTAIKTLKDEGITIFGVDSSGPNIYYEEKLAGSVAFIIGGEDRGINPTLLEKCDKVIRIPMRGTVPSLNVSVATAIVLYERLRQQESK